MQSTPPTSAESRSLRDVRVLGAAVAFGLAGTVLVVASALVVASYPQAAAKGGRPSRRPARLGSVSYATQGTSRSTRLPGSSSAPGSASGGGSRPRGTRRTRTWRTRRRFGARCCPRSRTCRCASWRGGRGCPWATSLGSGAGTRCHTNDGGGRYVASPLGRGCTPRAPRATAAQPLSQTDPPECGSGCTTQGSGDSSS